MPGKSISLRLIRYTKFSIITVIGVASLLFLYSSIQTLRFPYGIIYGEAPIINQANRITIGEVLYKNDFNSPPYIITNYTPIFVFLVSLINSTTGLNPFLAGRLISFISAVISVAVIALISYKLTKKIFISFIALGLFIGHPYVLTWSSVARVDLLALSLSLLGIYTALFHWRSTNGIFLAVALCTASIYTRQTYLLAGPLGISIWLFINNKKKFLLFISLLFTISVVVFIILNVSTKNGFFLNVFSANINEYSISRLISMLRNFLVIWFLVISIALFTLIVYLLKFRELTTDLSSNYFYFLIPYICGATISTLTVGKVGSDINYFLELIVALILISTVGFGRIEKGPLNIQLLVGLAILLQAIWMLSIILTVNLPNIINKWQNLEGYDDLYHVIEISTKKGYVLSDDYLDMVVLAGQQIYYQPFEYGQLFSAGIWNPDDLILQVEEKEFPLIVIGGNELAKGCCWPTPVSNAIRENYKITITDHLLLCKPKFKQY